MTAVILHLHTCKTPFTLINGSHLLFDIEMTSAAPCWEHLHPGRFLPTDSGLDVSETVCTSNRCLESTDRCSGCKLEAIARAVWCVEASLFPVRWWWSVFNGSLIEFIDKRSQNWLSKADQVPFSTTRISGKSVSGMCSVLQETHSRAGPLAVEMKPSFWFNWKML